MSLKIFLNLISFNIACSLLQNSDYFKLFNSNDYNTNSLKYAANFENYYLIKSIENQKDLLSLIECLSLNSLNVFTKSVSYEHFNYSRVICKLYAGLPRFAGDVEVSQSNLARIYSNTKNFTGIIFFFTLSF